MEDLRGRNTPKFNFRFGETIAIGDVLNVNVVNPKREGEKLQLPIPSIAIGAPGYRGLETAVKMLTQNTPNVPVRIRLTVHTNFRVSLHLETKPFDTKTQSYIVEAPWFVNNPFEFELTPDRGNQGFHKTRLKAEKSEVFAFYLVDTLTGAHVYTVGHKLHESESPMFLYLRHSSGNVGATLAMPLT